MNRAGAICAKAVFATVIRENFAPSDFSLYTASPIEQTVVEQGWQGVDQTFRCTAFRFGRPMVSVWLPQVTEIIGCAVRVWIVAKSVRKEW
jgi:hypothetical protein